MEIVIYIYCSGHNPCWGTKVVDRPSPPVCWSAGLNLGYHPNIMWIHPVVIYHQGLHKLSGCPAYNCVLTFTRVLGSIRPDNTDSHPTWWSMLEPPWGWTLTWSLSLQPARRLDLPALYTFLFSISEKKSKIKIGASCCICAWSLEALCCP